MLQSKMQNRLGALGDRLARTGMVLAVGLSLMAGLGARHAAVAGGQGESLESLSGTWRTTVTLINCATGAPLPIPNNPFPALNTFDKSGTMLETGGRSLFRSPGHGVWERTGPNEFLTRFIFFRFAADGSYIGTQEGAGTKHLTSPDTSTSEGNYILRDTAGNVVLSGCARETAERF